MRGIRFSILNRGLRPIVVASTATRWYGHEGEILRYVFFHSLVLAALVGVLVLIHN
ncbi:MAG: lactate permease [Blastocatellia bacterium]|jgi:L-lactate permease|nr:lactate permease [Blastocatellia bacterium]